MVDIANYPEAVAQIMGRPQDGGLDPLKDLIPAYARIQVRLCDKGSLDNCADVLAALAQELRLLARRSDYTQSQALFYAWTEVKTANAKMQASTRYRNQS